MGTVKRLRKKYEGPSHPWEAERLEEERQLKKEYGLKNKKEIWKIASKLKGIKTQAKNLIADRSEQARKEEASLLEKLSNLGILKEGSTLDNILEINVGQLMARRLQSMAMTKGLARSSRQARQMISHGHITINNNKTSIPSYLVKVSEEASIEYSPNSKFKDPEHPELVIVKKEDINKIDVKALPAKEKVEAPKEEATGEKVEQPKGEAVEKPATPETKTEETKQ
ncbi:30S ribosomal protein S4 [Candidatus Woesearchaeota archaeon]|jgi:small subunit ribosomal protein S4|nr:30S ribosomal protein S4 [Candidatus Woesearchaeota archaeon]MBT6402449.1 30S ribosomal protein S4 [Candidatus Woesearchaeota archaeon]